MEKDYDVGYAKPPEHTRFKKGRSGNPKGRPKGSKNMSTIFSDLLGRKITIRENGWERRIPIVEAIVHRMIAKALEGSPRDAIALMKAIDEYCPEAFGSNDITIHSIVEYVLPDGKTMQDYDHPGVANGGSSLTPERGSETKVPDTPDDEDDAFPN